MDTVLVQNGDAHGQNNEPTGMVQTTKKTEVATSQPLPGDADFKPC